MHLGTHKLPYGLVGLDQGDWKVLYSKQRGGSDNYGMVVDEHFSRMSEL